MQNFNFQSAIEAATKVVEGSESSGRDYTYTLVYPQAGHNYTIRPLFNPKSGLIVRLISRHEKLPCYRTYNMDCPICKVMEDARNLTGQDPFSKSASKSRGICFAQYISSTTPVDKGRGKGSLQAGEIIIMMFPWSVYSQMSAIIQEISKAPSGMETAFCKANSGLFINIAVSPDYKYTTTPNPYLTYDNHMSDDDFLKMLENMEDLKEQILPSTVTPELDKQVSEYCSGIYNQFIAPRTATVAPQNGVPMNLGQMTAPAQPNYVNTAVQQSPSYAQNTAQYGTTAQPAQMNTPQPAPMSPPINSGKPSCFGHNNNGQNCILCPAQVECMQSTIR